MHMSKLVKYMSLYFLIAFTALSFHISLQMLTANGQFVLSFKKIHMHIHITTKHKNILFGIYILQNINGTATSLVIF